MKRTLLRYSALLLTLLLIPFGTVTLAQDEPVGEIVSTFDASDEGWTVFGDAQSESATPDYLDTGGNPGGYVSASDNITGGTWYWSAPAKFLGNQAASFGQTLSFELRQSDLTSQYDEVDVVLSGGELRLTFDTATNPGLEWTAYSVLLADSVGWTVEATGEAATGAELQTVLGALDGLFIRGEYRDGADRGDLDNFCFDAPTSTAVEDAERRSKSFMLDQNYPNPFKGTTTIPFRLQQEGHARLVIYNMLGQEVTVLVDTRLPAGSHLATFEATPLPSGAYLYRLETNGTAVQSRMMLLVASD